MSFQPFVIGGPFKTGLYDYLPKWLGPEEAFEPLENAFVYRGVLQKRLGYTAFGQMVYKGIEVVGAGGGVAYSGTCGDLPVRVSSVTITDGTLVVTDDGLGVLEGDVDPTATNTIDYSTGVYTFEFSGATSREVLIYYTYTPAVATPIMGILEFVNASSSLRYMMACDQKRAVRYNTTSDLFDPIYAISIALSRYCSPSENLTINTGFTGLAHFSVSVTVGGETSTDDGAGVLAATGTYIAASTVDYATGIITLNTQAFGATTQAVSYVAHTAADYFSGTDVNLFIGETWNDLLYMTNNADRVTTFDGSNLGRPPFSVTEADFNAYTNTLSAPIDIKFMKNRMVFLKPIYAGTVYPQRIVYSQINVPQNCTTDVTGYGGFYDASTGDAIIGSGVIKDVMVVKFSYSDFNFRYTGNPFDPFKFELVSSATHNASPYGITSFDTFVTSIGNRGLTQTDGLTVQRYDENIPDFALRVVSQKYAHLCQSIRFDLQQQLWMTYVDAGTDAVRPTNTLIYNYREKTWSTTTMSFMCLGMAKISDTVTWEDMAGTAWEEADFPWDWYVFQSAAENVFGGGADGAIYRLNDSTADDGTSYNFNIMTNELNPYIKMSKKVQMPYMDIFYDSNENCEVTLDFFVDSDDEIAVTKTFSMDSGADKTYGYRRVYVSLLGKFIRWKMSLSDTQLSNPDSANNTFKINAFVIHCRPVGRMIS